MDRPEFVGDAIEFGPNGCEQGRYGSYVLCPAYQPIYSVTDRGTAVLTGFEGLIRPFENEFADTPENFFSKVDPEDRLFVECLCMALHIRGYRRATPRGGGLFINVNVANYPTVEDIEREFAYTFSQLEKHGLNEETVVFEILETKIENNDVLSRLCQLIRENGYKFALDDFGTNHSNVERYLAVKPDIIKLDRTLFTDTMKSRETTKLLSSLIGAFQANGVTVLMEGLETLEEMQYACEMKADMLQGFYLGMPDMIAVKFPDEVIIQGKQDDGLLKVVTG